MMTFVRVKGFKIYDDRHGVTRCYHRKSSMAIDLKKFPIGTAGFFAECHRIEKSSANPEKHKVGTLGHLIVEYKKSYAFQKLSPRTRKDYQKYFAYLSKISDALLFDFDPPLVVNIRDKATEKHGWRFGNYVKSVLALLFSWGYERGHIKTNPALNIRALQRPKDLPGANRPWTDEERHEVMLALPEYLKLPFALMMYCGLDPQDVVRAPRDMIKNGQILTNRKKTGVEVWINLPEAVKEILDCEHPHSATTLCVNMKGIPWTYNGLNSSWRKVRMKLLASGKVNPGLTMKGLRHTVANIVAQMGYDGRAVADLLGQETTEMGDFYARRAQKKDKLDGIVKNFDEEVKKRRT